MTFSGWLQSEVYRKSAGGTIAIPPGTYQLDGTIVLPPGVTGLTILGAGRELTTILVDSPHTGGLLVFGSSGVTLAGLTLDARISQPTSAAARFVGAAGMVVDGVRILGGKTACLLFDTACDGVEITDAIVGASGDLGPGKGRGIHITTGSLNIAVDGVRAYDDQLRHLVCLEDNVEATTIEDVATDVAHGFACLDLHGKLEGDSSIGSIAANGCAGRVNVGNPDHTSGSHLTLTNHNGQGKIIGVQVNSSLRYSGVTNATIQDQSGGSATIINMEEPE